MLFELKIEKKRSKAKRIKARKELENSSSHSQASHTIQTLRDITKQIGDRGQGDDKIISPPI